MTTELDPGESDVSLIEFFPTDAGFNADFYIEFSLQSSVPEDGEVYVTFPSGYTVPSLNTENCIFNL